MDGVTQPLAVQQIGDRRHRPEERAQPFHVEVAEWFRPAVLSAQDAEQQPTDHAGTSLRSIYAADAGSDALNTLQSPHLAFSRCCAPRPCLLLRSRPARPLLA